MMGLVFLLQAASVPPVPPPPQESHLAATALWQDNAPSPAEKRAAIDNAVGMAATGALARVGIEVIYTKKGSIDRWFAAMDRLKPVIARHVPTDLAKTDVLVAECVTSGLAYALSPDEIREIGAFASTPVGKKFWSLSRAFHEAFQECYRTTLGLKADDADLRAIGLRPPKPR